LGLTIAETFDLDKKKVRPMSLAEHLKCDPRPLDIDAGLACVRDKTAEEDVS